MRKGADYGILAPTLKKDTRVHLIVEHWDDLNRVAASLQAGLIRLSILVSRLQSMQQQNPLQQALQELGRVAKTLHILESRRSGSRACLATSFHVAVGALHLNGSYHFTDITLKEDFRPLREYQGPRLLRSVQPSVSERADTMPTLEEEELLNRC